MRLYGRVVTVLLLAGTVAQAQVVRTWDGGGTTENASEAANWSDDTLPTSADHIRLDATSAKDMFWDAGVDGLPDTVASWTQTADYTGTVTFDTRYPGQGDFQLFTIAGDAAITNGVWTHGNNTTYGSGNTERFRLNVKVNGSFTLAADATIDVDIRGYTSNQGDGAGASHTRAASHGGQGGYYHTTAPASVYGSVTAPTRLGSGAANSAGGGAVYLDVTGAALIDGELTAKGGRRVDGMMVGGAGGSIFLRAATLSGGGSLDASGGPSSTGDRPGGGGGRVAVILDDGDFAAFTGSVVAYGGRGSSVESRVGAAGTVYLETDADDPGAGTLILDNDADGNLLGLASTLLPNVNLGAFAAVIVTNKAVLGVTATTILNLGTDNLLVAGSAESGIMLIDQALTTYPDPFVISNFTFIAMGPLSATGDWTVADTGVMTHPFNDATEQFKLDLTLDGDLTVAAGGRIDADLRGYARTRGPGVNTGGAHGGSHGGIGGYHFHTASGSFGPTYGSIRAPTMLGSGSRDRSGGGAIRLDVSGALTVAATGLITANGDGYRCGAGGSIYIDAQTLAGGGTMQANGGSGQSGGGGGRVAVHLSGGDFSTFTGAITAFGGESSYASANTGDGAAGTVFLNWPTGSELRIVNYSTSPDLYSGAVGDVVTDIRLSEAELDDLLESLVDGGQGNRIRVVQDATIGDLVLGTGSALNLNGYTLHVNVPEQPLDGTVTPNGGQLIWWTPIFNTAAANVTATTAELGGTLVTNALTETIDVYVFWGTNDAQRVKTAWTTNMLVGSNPPDGPLTQTVEDLIPNQVYYYRFYATNTTAGGWTEVWAEPSASFNNGAVWVEKTADGSEIGPVHGEVVFYRDALLTNEAQTVYYSLGGDATLGDDYTVPAPVGSIVIPAGASSVAMTITVLPDDDPYEGTETVVVTIEPGAYVIGTPASATVEIEDGPVARIWTGLGANNLASNPENWSDNSVPGANEVVVLNATSVKPMTWDANASPVVAGWQQFAGYTNVVTFDTVYTNGYTNLTIAGNAELQAGTWTHANNATYGSGNTAHYRLKVNVEGTFSLAGPARIDVDGRGYAPVQGPGLGNSHTRAASHGGQGGYYDNTPGTTYGSITEPVLPGSGAQNSAGGGVVYLEVDGHASLYGTITALGARHADGLMVGAAGGSIFLRAASLSGSGTLDVSGNNGSTGDRPGGGGGRIAVTLTGGDFSGFAGDFAAYGARASDHNRYTAAAGTIYLEANTDVPGGGRLIIDNEPWGLNDQLALTTMPPDVDLGDFGAVVITNRGNLGVMADTTLDFGTVNVVAAGRDDAFITLVDPTLTTFPASYVLADYTLVIQTLATAGNWTVAETGRLTHRKNAGTDQFKLNLTLNGDLTVAENGQISVSGKGYGPRQGPGQGSSHTRAGSHGGQGGYYNNTGGVTYGSIVEPVTLGSGADNSAGGGAVYLDVSGAVVIEAQGSISARGAPQTGGNMAGGAGGSIYLRAASLTGGGTLDASGNNSTTADRPGGGGGRIAVILSSGGLDGFSGSIVSHGGINSSANNYRGAAGTIYLETDTDDPGSGTLIVDNDPYGATDQVALTMMPPAADLGAVTALVITNRAHVGIVADTVFDFGSIDLHVDGPENSQFTLTDPVLTTFPDPFVPGDYRINLGSDMEIGRLVLGAQPRIDLNGFTLTVASLSVDGENQKWGDYPAASFTQTLDSDPELEGLIHVLPPPPGTLFLMR